MRAAFGAEFDVPDGYANTASIGIPPTTAVRAVQDAVSRWGSGTDRPEYFDSAIATGRAAFASLVGTSTDRVALGASVSQLIGLIAASVPAASNVLVAAEEFTSVTFPFAAQQRRGVQVTELPLELIGAHAAEYDVVAVSVVQSKDGRIVDLAALRAARTAGTRVLLDVTQAAGWMPLRLDWADWVVGAAYKWLLSPRGAAWLAVHPDALEISAHSANWYAGRDPWTNTYGLPLRVADGPRGLDLSPVWLAHVGASVAMSWLASLDLGAVARHCTGLADRLRAELDTPPRGSPIVVVPWADAVDRLSEAGVTCAARAGNARLSFHLYNTDADVDRAVTALRDA